MRRRCVFASVLLYHAGAASELQVDLLQASALQVGCLFFRCSRLANGDSSIRHSNHLDVSDLHQDPESIRIGAAVLVRSRVTGFNARANSRC